MTTRLLVLWIALQTLLGAWFVSLLLAGSPAASPRADLDDALRPARFEPPKSVSTRDASEGPQRELATPEAAPATARDPVGTLLYGRVTDEQGNPVDDAGLSVRQQGEHSGACQTDARGTYALAGLPPGEAGLLVRTTGFRHLSQTLQLVESAQRHDLVLRRAVVLQVIVRTPTGEALTDALLISGIDQQIRVGAIATREPATSLPSKVRGIGIGRFRSARWLGQVQIEGAPPEMLGLLEIDGELPVHVSLIVGAALLQSQVVQPGQERVEFSLRTQAVREQLASVRLQLVAQTTGRPIAAMRIHGPGVKITDGDGVAEFVDVIAGQHRLDGRAQKHELDLLVQLEPGQRLDLGRVVLPEVQIVSGTVVDANGQPVYATISWDDLEGHSFAQPLRNDRGGGTDAQGRWQLRLAPQRHALHARTNQGAEQAHLLLDLSRGVPEQITLRLQPTAEVELVKQFAAGRSYLLSIRTRDGLPVFGSAVRGDFAQSIRLPVGDYLAEVYEGRTLVRSFALAVGSAGTQIRIP